MPMNIVYSVLKGHLILQMIELKLQYGILVDMINQNDVHPTQKPVFIPEEAIKNSSKQNEIVLDLFGGSGSTLIAAERTNRHAYLMELRS